MKLYVCCPNSDCGAFQDSLTFLKSYGVEPQIKVDKTGHYFKFKIKTGGLDILLKLTKKINGLPFCCFQCLKEKGEMVKVGCKACGEEFLICQNCGLELFKGCPYCR